MTRDYVVPVTKVFVSAAFVGTAAGVLAGIIDKVIFDR